MKTANVFSGCASHTRRRFLRRVTASLAGGLTLLPVSPSLLAATRKTKIRIGSCRLDLAQTKEAGLEGMELPIRDSGDKLQLSDPAVRQGYKRQMQETGVVISSLMMALLNTDPLARDPRAPGWLEQSIDAAKDLGATVILVPFFGKGDLRQPDGTLKPADVDMIVKQVQAAALRAKDAGVILALENTLSAKQNVQVLERIGNEAVKVYYDVGNSTRKGYDVPTEIRFLKDRIGSIHFKDGKSYLGEGDIKFEPIASAIKDIGYQGWIVLETSDPSKNAVADAKRNAAYIRKLFGMS
jgi:sugar phosphate isomerase/epimerase